MSELNFINSCFAYLYRNFSFSQSINQSINKFIPGNEAHKHTDTQTNGLKLFLQFLPRCINADAV